MLRYYRYATDGDVILYKYYLTGGGDRGAVSINKNTGVTSVIKQSEDDLGCRFAYKVIRHLENFFANGAYEDDGLIAWY